MPTRQVINNTLESDFKEIEKHLDSSFDKINNFIDQAFNVYFPISKQNIQKSELLQPKVDYTNVIYQLQFSTDIVQELIPQINSQIKHQVQIQLSSDQAHEQLLTNQQLSQQQLPQTSQSITSSSQLNLKQFTYNIIKENSIKCQENCLAVAFNQDCSIIAAGCNSLINLYEFRQGILKYQQLLNQHLSIVSNLSFMKKSNQFISGDFIGSILIWSSNHNNQWICSQKLQEHNKCINCLIMNKNEDIIISSSFDSTIKFWNKQKEWICQQTITDHKGYVCQLSLNENQNKVISCGQDQLILVIEYSEQNKKWMVIQNIQVDYYGFRICFINDNLFTFQPKKGNLMYVYEMNSVSKQFTQTKHISVNQGEDSYVFFPQQYIKSKQLLVNKHDNYINLIRKTCSDQFQVEQSIQFDSQVLYGQISDDGEYLITWDDSSKEIQLRRFREE